MSHHSTETASFSTEHPYASLSYLVSSGCWHQMSSDDEDDAALEIIGRPNTTKEHNKRERICLTDQKLCSMAPRWYRLKIAPLATPKFRQFIMW